MTIDIEALKKAAQAATPGPWKASDATETMHAVRSANGRIVADVGYTGYLDKDADNCHYIAAMSPDVALALIAEVEQALAAKEVALPENLDWNQQMEAIKALLPCTDGELECIGEKLLDNYRGDVDRVFAYVRTLTAPQPVAAPAGYKLVPIEPTPEQIEAGRWDDGVETAISVYKTMLAAAPEPKP